MKVMIKSFNVKASQELTDVLNEKFGRLDRFYDRISTCEVTLSHEKNREQKNCLVEAKLELPRKTLFAKENAQSFEIAMDRVLEALEDQIATYKGHLQNYDGH